MTYILLPYFPTCTFYSTVNEDHHVKVTKTFVYVFCLVFYFDWTKSKSCEHPAEVWAEILRGKIPHATHSKYQSFPQCQVLTCQTWGGKKTPSSTTRFHHCYHRCWKEVTKPCLQSSVFFFSTLLTFLNLISDDIGAFLFTLTGQNTSHLHTGAHQDPTPTLASSPQKKEKHRMDCVCWQMVPVPLYQSINHSPPGLHEENHFISAQRCYWLSAGNYQEKAIIPVSWFNRKEEDAWCCCHMTVPDFKRH